MANAEILATLREDKIEQYRDELSSANDLRVQIAATTAALLDMLAGDTQHIDLVLIDNELDSANIFVPDLRQRYPKLPIIIVDEEADFGTPGHASDLSCDPFLDDELIHKVNRLLGRSISTGAPETESQPAQSAVSAPENAPENAAQTPANRIDTTLKAIQEMGFDYVAYYTIDGTDPPALTLAGQHGPNAINAVAPKSAGSDDLMGHVAKTQKSQIAGPQDTPIHPLVARGRLGAVVCVPVSHEDTRYGVLAVCNDRPGSIQTDIMPALEMVASQLAAALKRDG